LSETLRDLVVSLSLQTDNFTRNMQSVNKQIKEAESSFKLASAGVDKFDQDAASLGSQLGALQSKLSLQKTAVDQYAKALKAANDKLQECFTRQNDYAKRLEEAKAQHDALRDRVSRTTAQYKEYVRTLGESDSAAIAAKANLDALKEEYRASGEELRRLAGQHTTLTKATQNAADAVTTANTRLNTAKGAARETEQAIAKTNASLTLAQTNWFSAGEAIQRANMEITSIGKQIRLAESEFRLATVGVRDMEQNVAGLTAQLTMLQEKLSLQQAAVQQYEAALAGAREQLLAAQQVNDPERIRQATDAVTDAQTALNNAKAAVRETESAIIECNASLSLAQTNWFSAGEAIQRANAEITSIGKQMQLAESRFQVATAGVRDMDQNVGALQARMTLLQEKLALQNAALAQYEAALAAAREQLAAAQAVNDPEKIRQATDAVTDAQTALNNASAAVIETVGAMGDCNAALDLAKTNWFSAGEAIQKANAEITTIGKEIQAAESEFKLASAGVKDMERDVTALMDKFDMLARKLELQQKAVEQYQNALNAAREQLAAAQAVNDPEKIRQANDAVRDAQTALNNANAAVKETRTALLECDDALALAETGWFRAGDAIKKAQSSIETIGKKMQLAESRYKLATAGLKDVDKSAEGLTARLTLLQEKLALQESAVRKYETALRGAREQLRAAKDAGDPEKINQARNAVIDAESALNRAKAAVRETQAAIESTNKALKTAQSSWTAVGKSMESFSSKCEKVSKSMTKAGRVLSVAVTTPIVALGKTAIDASLDFESSFTSVRKTVDATEEEFDELAASSKQMSTQVAASTSEINEVMATGGQLGIATRNLTGFTKVMIDLGNSCEDLSADEAATSLAKFANVMKTDQKDFDRVGSTLVDLGNNYATTEKAIMEMSQRLAGAGKQVGLTEAQVMGFAAALSSVGIEAQMGGSAFSKALVKMEVASATGGQALEDFGKVAGMTGQQFKALWDSDPAAAFQAFIVGLSRMDDEGESAIATLQEIGITEIRLRDTLLRATNATELFANTQATANKAWKENTALTTEANKRYATTESKLTNLKNKAMLFGQQLGNDLNPTIQKLIGGVSNLLDRFMSLDEAQRMAIIRFAAIAAATGPVMLGFGKVTKGIGTVVGGIGKFAAAVGAAGGGFSGFMSVLAKSPAVWAAMAVAVIAGTVALYDYVSGAKAAREALEGMAETAKKWKETAAETFYGKSQGLSYFGMSAEDFTKSGKGLAASSEEWLKGLITVWTDGEKETDAIVKQWTDSWNALTEDTRAGLQSLKDTADAAGYTGLSEQMGEDLKVLDSMDKEIASLLKRRQNGLLTDAEKVRLQELIDTRDAIAVKYKLVPETSDTAGFDTIRKKVEAEVTRAEARGQEASAAVYEEAMVAAAEGMAAINKQLDEQYDSEYAVIQLMTNEQEKQAALTALNEKYNANRKAAAQEYAQLMADVVMPVWEQGDIQEAKGQIGDLMQLLRQYSAAATDAEKKELLPQLNQLTQSMDEGALTEYIALLTQIQSLLDSGMSESEVQEMFPEIDFSGALDQLAAIQTYLNTNKWDSNLNSLQDMFGSALGEEVLTIATDLDMTGAQTRWDEWATNPGAITTDAIISGYTEAENATKQQPTVDAFVAKYTEIEEGADKSSLTPEGLVAYVAAYAEATTGADVSGLTPKNITAMVSAYKELATGADVSMLTPGDITAYIMKYLEGEGVDTSALTPAAVTAFVMAYEEVTGGASTSMLTPSDVTAMVVKYAEAEGVDLTALKPGQIEAIVSSFAEATGCDKSALLSEFVAYITEYKEAAGVKKPTLNMQVGLAGYDLMAYRRWLKENQVEVEGIVRLSEVYEDPSQALGDSGVKYWKDGAEIPVSAVAEDMLRPENVAILDKDGTMHILVTAEITGAPEAIAEMREQVAEVDQLGMTAVGTALTGIMPTSLMGFIDAAEKRIETFKNPGFFDFAWLTDLIDANARLETLDLSMQSDFDAENVAELSTYVAEVVKAIQNGEAVSEDDIANLQKILNFVQDLDSVGVGANVTEGIAEGMTEAGWDTSAETLAANLETAINSALVINSPSERLKPAGEYVAAGIGEGMIGYDFSTSAGLVATALEAALNGALVSSTFSASAGAAMEGLSGGMTSYSFAGTGTSVSANVRSAVSSGLNSSLLRPAGVNVMAGLAAGINAGRSGVIAAMRSATRAAVNAAKAELQIKSPSRVFRDEVGAMAMKGMGKGVTEEAKKQAKVIANATRFLTGEARDGAIGYSATDNRKTYNQTSSVSLTGNTFVVRDETDIRSLAVEIATLTKRQQHGKGMRPSLA